MNLNLLGYLLVVHSKKMGCLFTGTSLTLRKKRRNGDDNRTVGNIRGLIG